MEIIPIPDSPWSEKEVSIAGVNLIFEFTYNDRNQGWHITIKDLVGRDIVKGIKLSENWNVGSKYKARIEDSLGLTGHFFILRRRDSLKITRENLTTDFLFIYADESEIGSQQLIGPPLNIQVSDFVVVADIDLSFEVDEVGMSGNITAFTITPV